MKKYLYVLVAALAMLSLSSCAKNSESEEEPEAPSNGVTLPSTNDVPSRMYYAISALIDMVQNGCYVQTGSSMQVIYFLDCMLEISGPEGDYEGIYAVMGYGLNSVWNKYLEKYVQTQYTLEYAQSKTIVDIFKQDSRVNSAWLYSNGEFKILFKP